MLIEIEKKGIRNHLKLVHEDMNNNRGNLYEGVVIPISWDKNGYPRKFSLFMDLAEELVLYPLDKNLQISKYINKKVVVVGEKISDETLCFREIKIKNERISDSTVKSSSYDGVEDFQLHIPQFSKYFLMS